MENIYQFKRELRNNRNNASNLTIEYLFSLLLYLQFIYFPTILLILPPSSSFLPIMLSSHPFTSPPRIPSFQAYFLSLLIQWSYLLKGAHSEGGSMSYLHI